MTNKIDGGAFSWARQTIESEIFYNKPDKWFKIWFYLVSKAKWKDGKQFKRGQCFMKYEWIINSTGATKDQVKHCVEYLKAASMLATQKATRGFIITICNYNTYQNLDNYKSHEESHLKATQKPHRSHTILKKGNKDKNDKNIKEINKEDFLFLKDKDFTKTFKDYLDMRVSIKKKATNNAIELRLKDLHKYDIKIAIAMLENSIMNSYQGVFPLNNKTSQKFIPISEQIKMEREQERKQKEESC